MADQPRMPTDKPLKVKQPGSSEAAKEAAAAALRAQLQAELQNIKQCAYKVYECTQLTLEGYNYCSRHILQDKNAPYKQCAYVFSTNGKRCHLPALKDKKDTGYCNEHALKAHLVNSKRGSRCQPPHTAEVLLHSLSHYIKKPRIRTLSSSTQCSDDDHNIPDESDGVVTKSLDPFVDIDSSAMLASRSDILDLCSESESDVDATSYGSAWHDAHAESSDNDSIDSEQEDVLKHANVYSAEEITLITRDKLIRLQSLYIDQYRYLHHMLRERRRRYLYALKREKETCCSITNQIHDSPKEQRMYKKLKAYNSYHRKHGVEAICNKRLHECRLKVTEGVAPKPPTFSKCIFTEGGVKCGERALPVTRHCRKHILEDPNQVLFRACSKVSGDMECTTPVEAIFDDATCRLHMDIPLIRSYSQVRKDSESDYDDSLEANLTLSNQIATIQMATPQNQNVKTEAIDIAMGTIPAETLEINNALLKREYIKMEDPSENLHFAIPPADTEMALVIDNQSDMQVKCGNGENSPLHSEMETSVGVVDAENIEYHATEEVVDVSHITESLVAMENLVLESVPATEIVCPAVNEAQQSSVSDAHVSIAAEGETEDLAITQY